MSRIILFRTYIACVCVFVCIQARLEEHYESGSEVRFGRLVLQQICSPEHTHGLRGRISRNLLVAQLSDKKGAFKDDSRRRSLCTRASRSSVARTASRGCDQSVSRLTNSFRRSSKIYIFKCISVKENLKARKIQELKKKEKERQNATLFWKTWQTRAICRPLLTDERKKNYALDISCIL